METLLSDKPGSSYPINSHGTPTPEYLDRPVVDANGRTMKWRQNACCDRQTARATITDHTLLSRKIFLFSIANL